jgi:hypothetical protein
MFRFIKEYKERKLRRFCVKTASELSIKGYDIIIMANEIFSYIKNGKKINQ